MNRDHRLDSPRLRPLLAALLAALGLAGCGEERQPDPAARQAAPSPVTRPLAAAATEWAGVTIEVVEATRSAGTLLVRFRFANASPQAFEFGSRFGAASADRDTMADVTLLEPSGLRKYYVLRDREDRPACSTNVGTLRPGEGRLLFARFPAPADGVSRITIQIPHAAEMREVPIGRSAGTSASPEGRPSGKDLPTHGRPDFRTGSDDGP